MRKLMNTFAGKALMAAAVAGLATTAANAALSIDVRSAAGGKAIQANAGDTVTVNIFLVSTDPVNDLANGLGNFSVGVRSFNESADSVAWPVNRTPTDTVANASNGVNSTNAGIMDLGFSSGTNTDSNVVTGTNPDPNDTDLDRTGISGTQSSGGGWDPTYGKVAELQLGSASFTLLNPPPRGQAWTFDLNAFFSTTAGAAGGAVIKSLTGTDTTTNGVAATSLITSSSQIGAPVTVTAPIPEPASLGLLGLASLGLFRRRRNA